MTDCARDDGGGLRRRASGTGAGPTAGVWTAASGGGAGGDRAGGAGGDRSAGPGGGRPGGIGGRRTRRHSAVTAAAVLVLLAGPGAVDARPAVGPAAGGEGAPAGVRSAGIPADTVPRPLGGGRTEAARAFSARRDTAPADPRGSAADEDPDRRASRAGAPVRLGVEEAVRRAVKQNEQVLIARARRAERKGIVQEARAQNLPDVSLDFGYTRNLQTPVLFFNTEEGVRQIRIGNDNEYSFGLSLSQNLLDLSVTTALSAARISRESMDAGVEAARTDVALAARVDYYRVLLDRNLLDVQEQALEQARTRLRQVRDMFEAGTASEFDTLTARVEVENIRPSLIEARNRLALDRRRFKKTVGVGLDRPVVLTDSLTPPRPGDVPELAGLPEKALAGRSDVRSRELQVDLNRQRLQRQKVSALPTLSLNFGLTRRASSDDLIPPERDFSQSAFAGLNFSLPLFDGGARAGREQQMRALVDQSKYRLEQLREEVKLQVQEAHRNLRAARERIGASEANVARAERALEIARTRFRNGLSTQVEVNDAELAVTRARTNYARALFAYHVARARLQAALGRR